MGRRSRNVGEVASKNFTMRLTISEWAAWTVAARLNAQSVADFARCAVAVAVAESGFDPEPE